MLAAQLEGMLAAQLDGMLAAQKDVLLGATLVDWLDLLKVVR